MNKKIRNLIIIVLVCSAFIFVALHIDFDEGNRNTPNNIKIEVDENYFDAPYNLGDFLYKDIYINGKHINNWNLVEPFITIEGEIFVPMTESVQKALGLNIEFDDAKHHVIFTSTTPSMESINEGKCACNLQYIEVYWGHAYYFGNVKEEKIMAATSRHKDEQGNRILYVSLEGLKKYSGVPFTCYYDNISGLYISTIEGQDASQSYNENNAKYIEGHARFMMENARIDLDYETALFYEYLFRHETTVYNDIEQDLLMGICMVESRYNANAQSKSGAIGLLQILYKYAESSGYSEEMLKDPHYNIEYAASSLASGLDRVGGDIKMLLTAYNMGYYAMMRQINDGKKPSTSYADKCIYWSDMLKSWVVEKGYTDTFNEL